ncbi:MAG: hypothetical protein KKA81_10095 [Bacteroidetes bacterium]|nr:hypothetical protein [Bacteroidota bacterium]
MLITIAPFCLASGILFPLLAASLSGIPSQKKVRFAYGWESAGSLAGGIVYSFLLIFLFNSFKVLVLVLLTGVLFSIILYQKSKWIMPAFLSITLLMAGVILFRSHFYEKLIQSLYPGQILVDTKETPFGRLDVTRSGEQLAFYENGNIIFTSGDTEHSEETVHFPMALHQNPKNVLILSGGFAGNIQEAMKYNPDNIDLIEINPGWADLVQDNLPLAFPEDQVTVYFMDGRRYVKQSNNTYDIIISDIPGPSTSQLNRYFTLEFFREVHLLMKPGAIFCLHLDAPANYLNAPAENLHETVNSTLKMVFKNTLMIPGSSNYFLASDSLLDYEIVSRLQILQLPNQYVSAFHLIDDSLVKMRAKMLLPESYTTSTTNTDLRPVAYKYHLLLWLDVHGSGVWIFSGVLLILSLITWIFSSSLNKGLFITGFSGVSLEFIIILIIQSLYGYSYYLTGIIITLYMAGIAAGSLFFSGIVRNNMRVFLLLQLSLGILCFALFPITVLASEIVLYDILNLIMLSLIVVITGGLSGMIFSAATGISKLSISGTAATAYGADLAGSAAGALLSSVYLVPALGLINTCLILGGLNIFNAFFVWLKQK